jgi:hypothetical protein
VIRIAAACLTVVALTAACSGSTDTGAPAAQPTSPAPAVTSEPSTPTPTETDPPETDLEILSEGDFERIGYEGKGTATIVDSGKRVEVRFTDFSVEEGPALRVYLSTAPAGSPESRYDDDFVDLGALTAFEGDQSYPLPADVDPGEYRSVVIWCAEFSVGFVVAPIDA